MSGTAEPGTIRDEFTARAWQLLVDVEPAYADPENAEAASTLMAALMSRFGMFDGHAVPLARAAWEFAADPSDLIAFEALVRADTNLVVLAALHRKETTAVGR